MGLGIGLAYSTSACAAGSRRDSEVSRHSTGNLLFLNWTATRFGSSPVAGPITLPSEPPMTVVEPRTGVAPTRVSPLEKVAVFAVKKTWLGLGLGLG